MAIASGRPPGPLPERLPEQGELVQVRSRRWLVEEVTAPDDGPLVVRLACAEDDAQGEQLDVLWDYELDRRILEGEGWNDLAARGFDDPRQHARRVCLRSCAVSRSSSSAGVG